MITYGQSLEIMETTLAVLPLPSVEEMLFMTTYDPYPDTMLDFIYKHYTPDEIQLGIKKHLEQMRFVNKLFGGTANENGKS